MKQRWGRKRCERGCNIQTLVSFSVLLFDLISNAVYQGRSTVPYTREAGSGSEPSAAGWDFGEGSGRSQATERASTAPGLEVSAITNLQPNLN